MAKLPTVTSKPIANQHGVGLGAGPKKQEVGAVKSAGNVTFDPSIVGSASKQHKIAVQGVETERQRQPMDEAIGVHLDKVLLGQTLSGNAANAKHLAKMEAASEIIGTLERFPGKLGSVTAFKPRLAFELYEHLFPNPDEREPVKEIKDRLKNYNDGAKVDGSGFFAMGIADKDRNVIGYTQGSTVPSKNGLFFYWQYGGVADRQFMLDKYGKDSNPREHGILNTIHGVNTAILNATAQKTGQAALGCIWESEPRGLADNATDIQFTAKRLDIHNRAGGRVMMGVGKDGELINLHLQPRLTADSEPIALHMMYRPQKYKEGDELEAGEIKKSDAEAMLMAWVDNFRVEGFAKKDVGEAEREIARRLERCEKIVLLPAANVPDVVTLAKTDDILRDQIFEMYGVKDLESARKFYDESMTAKV